MLKRQHQSSKTIRLCRQEVVKYAVDEISQPCFPQPSLYSCEVWGCQLSPCLHVHTAFFSRHSQLLSYFCSHTFAYNMFFPFPSHDKMSLMQHMSNLHKHCCVTCGRSCICAEILAQTCTAWH